MPKAFWLDKQYSLGKLPEHDCYEQVIAVYETRNKYVFW